MLNFERADGCPMHNWLEWWDLSVVIYLNGYCTCHEQKKINNKDEYRRISNILKNVFISVIDGYCKQESWFYLKVFLWILCYYLSLILKNVFISVINGYCKQESWFCLKVFLWILCYYLSLIDLNCFGNITLEANCTIWYHYLFLWIARTKQISDF